MLSIQVAMATARYQRLQSGVLVVRAGGVVTMSSMVRLHSMIIEREGARIAAAVVDYTGAAVAATGPQLAAWARDLPEPARRLPVALVTSEMQEPAFLHYAGAVATCAINRQVFRHLEDGLRWAVRHAERRKSTLSLGRLMGL